jgi:hypothetical protein
LHLVDRAPINTRPEHDPDFRKARSHEQRKYRDDQLAELHHDRRDQRRDDRRDRIRLHGDFAPEQPGRVMINWDIAGHPLNWVKIGLMAAIFLFAVELVANTINPPNGDPSPNIMP